VDAPAEGRGLDEAGALDAVGVLAEAGEDGLALGDVGEGLLGEEAPPDGIPGKRRAQEGFLLGGPGVQLGDGGREGSLDLALDGGMVEAVVEEVEEAQEGGRREAREDED